MGFGVAATMRVRGRAEGGGIVGESDLLVSEGSEGMVALFVLLFVVLRVVGGEEERRWGMC